MASNILSQPRVEEEETNEIQHPIHTPEDPESLVQPAPNKNPQLERFAYAILVFLVVYALGTYWYGPSRYRGFWGENDTQHLTNTLYYTEQDNSIINQREAYGNGMSFQALSIYLIRTSGISMQDLQLFVFPTIAALLPLAAFNFYRIVTGSVVTALFATLLLFIQPDFLWVTWRGSHEKFTWFMALLILSLVARSFVTVGESKRRPQVMLLITFVFLAFTFISMNAFFASAFTASLAISSASGIVWLMLRRFRKNRLEGVITRKLWTLPLLTSICAGLLYAFFVYIYPPALGLLRAANDLLDSLSTLFLFSGSDSQPETANAYDFLDTAYVNPRMFLVLSGASLLLMAFSGLVWLRGAADFLLKKTVPVSDLPRILLWLVYSGFALQLVLSVFADRVATVGANIQVRLFAPMMILAIPMATIGIHDLLKRFPEKPRSALIWSLVPAIMVASILGIFKMTNEPIVSNNWIYTTAPERRAAEWVIGSSEEPSIWEGRTLRQRYYLPFVDPSVSSDYFRAGRVSEITRYYLISDLERASWIRAGQTLPYVEDEFRIYDNGQAQIYYRRPTTIYQR